MQIRGDMVEDNPTQDTTGFDVAIMRMLGWVILAITLAFVVDTFLTFGAKLPGAAMLRGGDSGSAIAWLQFALYPLCALLALMYVVRTPGINLRIDSERVSQINTFFIRAAFWTIFLVGLADMVIAFLRVEDLLESLVGEQLALDLGRSLFRGPYVHMPLMVVGVIIALFTRTLGFHWLALLIVGAELLIVIARFVFSYEQAFMADLVRYWYGGFFLFASAYTLLEEGHVRVDVFYAGFKEKTRGMINLVGSLFMGIVLCWTILLVGMGSKSSVINSPIFNFEVTQSAVGLYVKYMMAGFLGVFAISMMIQFVSYMFAAWADYKGHPGKRLPETAPSH